jgi:hypothetical protein
MIEVFKTNVKDSDHANVLVSHIHCAFTNYSANFDLQDCDRILRIKCTSGFIDCSTLLRFLESFGCYAEALNDDLAFEHDQIRMYR